MVEVLLTPVLAGAAPGGAAPERGVRFVVGDIVALSVVRELGPVLAALMVAGRVGAGATFSITLPVDGQGAMEADHERAAKDSGD